MSRNKFAIPVVLVFGAVLHAAPVQPTRSTAVQAINVEATGTVQGKVVDSTNVGLSNAIVDLRDVHLGRIAGTQLADETGRFVFERVDPGTYVVEILGRGNSNVLATSELLHVSGGDVLVATVKVPLAASRFASLLATPATQTVALLASVATAGILARVLAAPLEPVSP